MTPPRRRPHLNRFQSSPTPKGGCDSDVHTPRGRDSCFNPHPPRRAGATGSRRTFAAMTEVSILTHPEGRVRPTVERTH